MKRLKKQHLNLLCDVGDLASLVAGGGDIEGFLQKTVEMVACHLHADVGSIYLFDDQGGDLVLKATVGLNPCAVNTVRMKPGEGLVGLTFIQDEPMREGRASRHPRFKYFEEAEEERLESFMAVPIRRGTEKIGVMVVQDEQPDYFSGVDVLALKAIASQLAGAVENARLFMDLNTTPADHCPIAENGGPQFVKGEPIMGGYAMAPAVVLRSGRRPLMDDRPDDAFFSGRDAFDTALAETSRQLEGLQDRLNQRLPESAALIFEAHFMILKDQRFLGRITDLIAAGQHPPAAVRTVAREYMARFEDSTSAYLREKADDIEDLARRILHNLLRERAEDPTSYQGRIVIAPRLYPSEMLKLATEDVAGVVLVNVGLTAHVAIIARSLRIPMVIADRQDLVALPPLTTVLLDADIGNVYVSPSARIVKQFEQRNAARDAAPPLAAAMQPQTALADGRRIRLLANINLLSELALAQSLKAEGVGLYRTEFPFMARAEMPSEEEQFWVYRRFFDSMPGAEMTIRTLDVGGDKLLPYMEARGEANPELGLRSIRFTLKHPDLFQQQIRAILRAAENAGRLRILFPMISSIEDLLRSRRMVAEAIRSLERDGLAHNREAQLGVMVELPSTIPIAGALAEEADFFSIGTNDFVQYMLAVDRSNTHVSDYYLPEHPAVLRGIAAVVEAALACGKDVSVCGEMARMAPFIPFFAGIGVSRLSVAPQFLPAVQQTVSRWRSDAAGDFARALLAESTLAGVREVLLQEEVPAAEAPVPETVT